MARYDFAWDRGRHVRRYCRTYGAEQDLFFVSEPHTPPPVNPEAAPASSYPPERLAAARQRVARIDRRAYLRGILDHMGRDAMSDRERVTAICEFVSRAIYYNPTRCPNETDPVALLELHDARCGQGVAVTMALLAEAGIDARQVPVHHHVTGEAFYDGGWHSADALMFGGEQPERDGEVLSVAALQAEPYFADAFPLRCFVYHPEELLSSDGYRLLGYVFGEWGSLPYYSWYMGAPKDCPPTLPHPLVTQRLEDGRVRLRWTPSIKLDRGRVEYRVRVFDDRARAREVAAATVVEPHFDWDVPEQNRHYYYDVCAMDDHRQQNPATWYPTLPGNFVLVPPDQYGWYSVL